MLSLQQAIEIRESVLAYLKATFTFQDKKVHQAFYNFVTHPTEGIFKGPYVSLKLPFVKASPAETEAVPLDIRPSWTPYDHQVKAWQRLGTLGRKPQPTIVTTGTGSGKTESFMYPVLDYCYQNLHRAGIKVIILYPMNALATDQARRLAQAIYDDKRLQGKVTAGLFIGEGKNAAQYPKSMGNHHIIENKESILSSPPDILLTNFKMLDYGLMKHNYHDLWLGNLKDRHLLQFLVLDELHTYDGAQGTDVANLIRRLKLKLGIAPGHLCPVGTSATIGSGKDAPTLLSAYASRIFGENITPEAIIGENRQRTTAFFGKKRLEDYLPRARALHNTKPQPGEGYQKYIQRQKKTWQVDQGNLADELKQLRIVKDLVTVTGSDEGIKTIEEVIRGLAQINPLFRKDIPAWDEEHGFHPKKALIQSLFSLIAEAKITDPTTGRQSPFMFSQTQLWVRELSGLLRVFDEEPAFAWRDRGSKDDAQAALPPWFCRECGASGWLAVKQDNKESFEREVQDVYNRFFERHKNIYFANLTNWFGQREAAEAGYEADDQPHRYVDKQSLEFYSAAKPGRVDITAFRKVSDNKKGDQVCPECNTRNTLSIIGTRIATLSSLSVGQALSTDLDTQTEQQRKVLAFTNSVQDAAHQAGFIEARNYRFTFRSSLQKVINQQNKPIALGELANQFIAYWKTNAHETDKQHLDAYYYRFYPKDYLGKSSPENYHSNGHYTPRFQREFDQRVRWEIYSEFGYNALIGRTLEKTLSSGVYIAPDAVAQVWQNMQPWLAANDVSQTIVADNFRGFLLLWLHRVRTRGAISHVYFDKFRNNDLRLWDLNWQDNKTHFLNRKFGPRTRLPRLLTSHQKTRGVLDSTFSRHRNWFHVYFAKTFPMASSTLVATHSVGNPHVDFVNEFYGQLIEATWQAGIFDKKYSRQQVPSYALSADKIQVVGQVQVLECKQCGHQVFAGGQAQDMAQGKCLNYRCHGTYDWHNEPGNNAEANYYQLVYNRRRSPRIYATEHTGLLERKRREIIENDFKQRPRFNSKNAMVATSTLEMGIDIGSLNTAFNNSVPPLPSSFLQRTGRAGRASGSALIVNFVQNKAHDLFYYQEPLDMMAGEVNTPGCYLEAKEILRRHFFAFCIDSWTASAPAKNHIPGFVRYLDLERTDTNSATFFIHQILGFVKANETRLLDRFASHYQTDIDQEVFDKLKANLQNEQFYTHYKNIFPRLKKEIAFVRQRIAQTKQQLKDLRLGKDDPESIALHQEMKNMKGIISSIKKRPVLEFLTNIGVLPNYAFPETGALLNATVLGNAPEGSTSPPMNKNFEIVRAASQAIREFAPDNYFYSQGFRFEISGINTFDWADSRNLHQKRFCSNCDHIETDGKESAGNCPKCGHHSWKSSANVHSFARISSVKSVNSQAKATPGDSKDERENLMYQVIRHFRFKSETSAGAWAMREIPFGIEFVKNVVITDTNLGRTDVVSARRVKLNDTEAPAHGFITCRHCGKSSSNIYQNDYRQHYGFCKYRDDKYKYTNTDQDKGIYEEVFLFREIETEALKILLPVQELDSEAGISMFGAGIALGLKKYFRGNPQHITISHYREYNHQTLRFDRYLVLFDTIPGGTGYLEKLFDREAFSELLTIAFEEIRECGCQHQGKDGCYRCIYSYQNQYKREHLSRQKAEAYFAKIVQQSEDWESLPHGLASVTNTGQIEESELEDRFWRSLEVLARHEAHWTFESRNMEGVINYLLTYENDQQTRLGFHIRPQVYLAQNEGVVHATRADFLIICTEARIMGKKIADVDLAMVPKVAVYMDGYQYHASSEHNYFTNDFKKRQAINATSEYTTWTLTWDDMEKFDERFLAQNEQKNRSDFLYDKLLEDGFVDTFSDLRKKTGAQDVIKLYEAHNSLERLLKFLQFPLPASPHFTGSWALYLGLFQQKLWLPSYAPQDLLKAMDDTHHQENYHAATNARDGWVLFDGVARNPVFALKTLVNLPLRQAASRLELLQTKALDKSTWNAFWNIYNLIQFFPINNFSALLPHIGLPEVPPSGESDYDLDGLLKLFDEVYHETLRHLVASGKVSTTQDEIGLNVLLDDNGKQLAEANLIIDEQKLVFAPLSEEDKQVFVQAGYTIGTSADLEK